VTSLSSLSCLALPFACLYARYSRVRQLPVDRAPAVLESELVVGLVAVRRSCGASGWRCTRYHRVILHVDNGVTMTLLGAPAGDEAVGERTMLSSSSTRRNSREAGRTRHRPCLISVRKYPPGPQVHVILPRQTSGAGTPIARNFAGNRFQAVHTSERGASMIRENCPVEFGGGNECRQFAGWFLSN